jgi:hypothetical protein
MELCRPGIGENVANDGQVVGTQRVDTVLRAWSDLGVFDSHIVGALDDFDAVTIGIRHAEA